MNTTFPMPQADEKALDAEINALASVFEKTFSAAPNLAYEVAETIIREFHQRVRVLVGALAEELTAHPDGGNEAEIAH